MSYDYDQMIGVRPTPVATASARGLNRHYEARAVHGVGIGGDALFTLVGIAGEDDLDAPDFCNSAPSSSASSADGGLRPSPKSRAGRRRASQADYAGLSYGRASDSVLPARCLPAAATKSVTNEYLSIVATPYAPRMEDRRWQAPLPTEPVDPQMQDLARSLSVLGGHLFSEVFVHA